MSNKKKQQKAMQEEAKKETDFEIKVAKLELREGRIIKPFIENKTDHGTYPSYIIKQALRCNLEMDEEGKEEKINFLLSKKIQSTENEDGSWTFEKIEPKPEQLNVK